MMCLSGSSPLVSTTTKLSPKSVKIVPKRPLVSAQQKAMRLSWQ
jgi:hypothetical protein